LLLRFSSARVASFSPLAFASIFRSRCRRLLSAAVFSSRDAVSACLSAVSSPVFWQLTVRASAPALSSAFATS